MDPNLFHIDYDRLIETLLALIILSIFIERALSVLYETEIFNRFLEVRIRRFTRINDIFFVKELLAFALSIFVCWFWNFDALTIILTSHELTTVTGEILTAAIVAGGSKVSSAIFHDFLGIMSSAQKKRKN